MLFMWTFFLINIMLQQISLFSLAKTCKKSEIHISETPLSFWFIWRSKGTAENSCIQPVRKFDSAYFGRVPFLPSGGPRTRSGRTWGMDGLPGGGILNADIACCVGWTVTRLLCYTCSRSQQFVYSSVTVTTKTCWLFECRKQTWADGPPARAGISNKANLFLLEPVRGQ